MKVRIALLLTGVVIMGGSLFQYYGYLPDNQLFLFFSVPYINVFGCMLIFVGMAATGKDKEVGTRTIEDPTPGFGAKKQSTFSDWFSGDGSGGGGDSGGGGGGD